MRIRFILIGCGDLPPARWTDETLRLAMRTFKFWPAVADVDELL